MATPSDKSPGETRGAYTQIKEEPAGSSEAARQVAVAPSKDTANEGPSGIQKVSANPYVPTSKIRGIAAVRSAILTLFFIALLVILSVFWKVTLRNSNVESDLPGIIDFCAPKGPEIHGRSLAANEVQLLSQHKIKISSFRPTGPGALALGLPVVKYFVSEENYATDPQWSLGLSLGSFETSDYHFHLEVDNVAEQKKCIEALAKKVFTPKHGEAEPAVQLFGQAVVNLLKAAKRREPDTWLLTTPAAHGALLVRTDTNFIWSESAGGFAEKYVSSNSWKCYFGFFISATLALFAVVAHVGGKFSINAWAQSLEVWAEQYEYVWEAVDKPGKGPSEPGTPESKQPLTEATSPQSAFHSTFTHKIQAASLFFLLDHLVDDPYENSESWSAGIKSALVDGAVVLGASVLPVVSGIFFSGLKPFVFGLVAFWGISMWAFGLAYFWAFSWRYRSWLFYMHGVAVLLLGAWQLMYLSAVLVFMVTRLIVDPKQVENYAAALGTVIVISAVVLQTLTRARETFMKRLEGKENKGNIIKGLRALGLDFKSIVISVIGIIILVLVTAALAIFAGQLYFGSSTASKGVSTVITPITGFAAMVQQLQKKQAAVEKEAGQISGNVMNVV